MIKFLCLFGFHAWEWEKYYNGEDVKICRKCGKEKGCEK